MQLRHVYGDVAAQRALYVARCDRRGSRREAARREAVRKAEGVGEEEDEGERVAVANVGRVGDIRIPWGGALERRGGIDGEVCNVC